MEIKNGEAHTQDEVQRGNPKYMKCMQVEEGGWVFGLGKGGQGWVGRPEYICTR